MYLKVFWPVILMEYHWRISLAVADSTVWLSSPGHLHIPLLLTYFPESLTSLLFDSIMDSEASKHHFMVFISQVTLDKYSHVNI